MGELGFSGTISTVLEGFGRFSLSFSVGGAIVSSFVGETVVYLMGGVIFLGVGSGLD